MPPELIPDDEDYASEEDSDFAPDAAPPQASDDSSASESEGEDDVVKKSKSKSTKRKRSEEDEAEDAGFENSGDEAIIGKGLKTRKKGNKEGNPDDGGEGGLIKTRSMRALEKTEKKPLVDTAAATVDVDALWESMMSGKVTTATNGDSTASTKDAVATADEQQKEINGKALEPEVDEKPAPQLENDDPDAMIVIKRTYKFAGQVHTEEKLVPKNSAEAKLYLSSQPAAQPDGDDSSPFTKPKRPIKKLQRSRFEPIIDGLPQRTDLYFGKRAISNNALLGAKTSIAKKLNTVEKSAMDWAGFVDREGIKDELDAASKAKGAYKSRQEFLARVEEKREEEARRARAK